MMNNIGKNTINIIGEKTTEKSKTFMSNIFILMFIALIVSGLSAYFFGTDIEMKRHIYNIDNEGSVLGIKTLGYISMIAPLGLVLLIGARINKMKTTSLIALFILFSVLMGISLSSIFMIYSISSIYNVFFVTSAMFAFMAIIGYTTKTDLTKFGSLLMMALVGIIIASVANWFINSDGLEYLISFAGVIIFTGLTAYDVQKLKEMSYQTDKLGNKTNNYVILGALNLYLDFVNLFLFLLRLFGGNKD